MNPDRICYGCFQEKGEGSICPHCGFDAQATQPYLALPLGTILNGRYMTGKVLGMGGFGITYLGYDLTLQIRVAIKEYMPSSIATRHADRYGVTLSGLSEQDYRYGMERFLDEARILAKLQNTPNIVSVQNYFKENNTAYFVMEYVDGMSLKAYLEAQGGKIPYTQALTILQPIMEALAQVHAMNLLHRDISPDNIFITTRGESRLLDFGAARFALGDEKSVSVILKHGYAPEEQYSSHGNQGPWTDVYAMGATLYRCITGTMPPDSVERLRQDTLKLPSELGVHVPKYVEQALGKALAVHAADRFANMEAFIQALSGRPTVQERVAAGVNERTQAGRSQTVYHGRGQAPSPGMPSGISRLLAYLKANPVVAWVSGGCLVLVLALCIILPLALSGRDKDYGPVSSSGSSTLPMTGSTLPPAADSPAIQPTTAPSAPQAEIGAAVEYVQRDLGALNASLTLPDAYTPSEDGFSFVDQQNNRVVETSFMWNIGVPIYTLADVEANQTMLLELVIQQMGNVQSYEVLGSTDAKVNGQEAFLLVFEASDASGAALNASIVAVESQNGYGCYVLLGAWRVEDEAGAEEVATILDSFRCNGPAETTYAMWYGEDSAVKVIVDDSITQGRVYDMSMELDIGNIYALYLYPTDEAEKAGSGNLSVEGAGNVEIGEAAHYGAETPEEMLDFTLSLAQMLDCEASDRYALELGGLEWLCQDYVVQDYTFSYASAMIDGACYVVGCMYDDSTENAILALYQQALSSVRPWEG